MQQIFTSTKYFGAYCSRVGKMGVSGRARARKLNRTRATRSYSRPKYSPQHINPRILSAISLMWN